MRPFVAAALLLFLALPGSAQPTAATNHGVNGNTHFGKDGEVTVLMSRGGIKTIDVKSGKALLTSETKMIDVKSGKVIAIFTDNDAEVMGALFSPDATKVVTVSRSGVAVIWDAKTRERLHTLKHGPREIFLRVEFSLDGTKLMTRVRAEAIYGIPTIWDVKTGIKLATINHAGEVSAVALSPDGAKVLTAYTMGKAAIWDAKSGEKLVTLKPTDTGHDRSYAGRAAFSPDGTKVAMACGSNIAAIWDARTGDKLRILKHADDELVAAFTSGYVAYSPDGTKLLTHMDQRVVIWDAKTGAKLHAIKFDRGDVRLAHFSPDGTKIVAALDDGPIANLWDAKTGKKLHDLVHENKVYHAAFSPDSRKLVTFNTKSSFFTVVAMWNVETGEKLSSLNVQMEELPVKPKLKKKKGP